MVKLALHDLNREFEHQTTDIAVRCHFEFTFICFVIIFPPLVRDDSWEQLCSGICWVNQPGINHLVISVVIRLYIVIICPNEFTFSYFPKTVFFNISLSFFMSSQPAADNLMPEKKWI